jgi:hypothetical protein
MMGAHVIIYSVQYFILFSSLTCIISCKPPKFFTSLVYSLHQKACCSLSTLEVTIARPPLVRPPPQRTWCSANVGDTHCRVGAALRNCYLCILKNYYITIISQTPRFHRFKHLCKYAVRFVDAPEQCFSQGPLRLEIAAERISGSCRLC